MSIHGRLILAVAFFVAVAALFSPSAVAQPAPEFKAGDRVEVDTIMASSPSRSIWKKGRVVKVDTTTMAYFIELDPLPGQLPKQMVIPLRPYAAGWIRHTGGTAPAISSDRLRVDANGTVLANRPLLDCERAGNQPARNGQPLPSALARTLIRCLYEKPSVAGADGAVTMDITRFVPGTPRRWNPKTDSGAGATLETIVYPIRVAWNQKTFYRTRNVTETGNERIFTCFVDVDKWFCGSAQYIKDGPKVETGVR